MTFLTPTKITRWHVNGWKCKNSWKTEIKKNFLPLDWFFPNLKHVFSSVVRWKQEQFLRFCPFYPVWEKGKHKSPARLPHDHYFCQIATWISNYLVTLFFHLSLFYQIHESFSQCLFHSIFVYCYPSLSHVKRNLVLFLKLEDSTIQMFKSTFEFFSCFVV